MLIAITGTIGSGKSTLTAILKDLGYNVISCDEINAELLKDVDYLNILEANFGGAVKNGVINKKALSNIIFNDEKARQKLNGLAHPLIKKRVMHKISKMQGDVYIEVPLLAESGMENLFDKIWIVTANKDKQIERVAQRDNITFASAEKIYNIQNKYNEYYMPLTVIENNAGIAELRKTVKQLLCLTE